MDIIYCHGHSGVTDSLTKRFSGTATFIEAKLPIPIQKSNPNLTNFVNTSYIRTPPCWYCRRDEAKHACTGACTRICPWQTATCALFKLQNLFRTQKAWSHELMLAFALRVSHSLAKEKCLCAPASVQNWQPKFLSTVMKRPYCWLYSSAFRKIKGSWQCDY